VKLYLKSVDVPKVYHIYRNFSKFFDEWDREKMFDCYIFDNDADLNIKGVDVIKSFINEYGEDKRKFILLSSKEGDIGKRIKDMGIKFFQKPIKPREFISHLKNILEQGKEG
jgi:DNA-binding NtrC family response regulator